MSIPRRQGKHRKQCAAILRWWDVHGRFDLPWQQSHDPYSVVVAELMLQQTGVTTVIPYYQRFMRHFPNAGALARADIDQVMGQWQGLGYYARARNLKRTCEIVNQRGGRWPDDAQGWMQLPGIGRSTANAVMASISDIAHPILDGNVKRVLSRLFAINHPVNHPETIKHLWHLAGDFLPARRGRDFAQAMMDLGALVCTRTKPSCAECPVRTDCISHRQGMTDQIPVPGRKTRKTIVEHWLLLIRRSNGKYLLGPRPVPGVWGGLWTPPMPETDIDITHIGRWLRKHLGLNAKVRGQGEQISHELTHLSMRLHPVELTPLPPQSGRLATRIKATDTQYGWHLLDNVPGGMPAPLLKLAERLQPNQ